MVWLTGSGIFIPVLRVQMQVQVLPVATAATLVCRYMVKYHGECFDIASIQDEDLILTKYILILMQISVL